MTSVRNLVLSRQFALHWLYLCLAALAAAALLAFDGYGRYQEKDLYERERLLAQARTVAINLEQQIALTKASLDSIVNDLPSWRKGDGYSDGLLRRIKALDNSLPGIRTILVTDSRGIVRAGNRDPLLNVDFSHREWFKGPRESADPGTMHLSLPYTSVTNVWIMTLSRAIPGPDGEFAGAVVMALKERYFETLLHSVNYAADGWVAVLHGDGAFFTGVPSRARFVEKNAAMPESVFARHMASGKRENVLTGKSIAAAGESPAVGERMVGIVTIGGRPLGMNRPLVVCVTRSTKAVFADWRMDMTKKAIVFMLLLAVAAIVLKSYHVRERRVAAGAEEAAEKIRLWADAFEQCAYGIALCIPATGRVLTCNPVFAGLLGRAVEEVADTEYMDQYMPSERDDVGRMHEEADRAGQAQFRSRMVRKDGTTFPVEAILVSVKDGDGAVAYRVLNISDIGEREMTEAALKFLSTETAHLTGAAFFEAIAKRMASILDADVGVVARRRVNPAGRLETVGLSVDGEIASPVTFDIAGMPCAWVLKGDFAVFPEDVQKAFPGGSVLAALGATSYAGCPLLDSRNRVMGVIGVMGRRPFRNPERIENILRLFALRTASEMERQRAESQFHGLFEFSPDAVLLATEEGRVVLANRRATDLLGYSGEEIVGMTVEQFMPESVRSSHAELRRGYLAAPSLRLMGRRPDGFHAQRKDGSIINVDIALGPIEADDGERLTIVELRDITAQIEATAKSKALEAQLRQSQKMDAVGRLSGGIAHDFNNLLQVVSINAEMAKDYLPEDDRAIRHIGRIAKAADRAADLTQRLLAFSRGQSLMPKAVDLGKLTAEIVPMLERTLSESISIEVVEKGLPPTVFVDPGELESTFLNLAVNARDAMPDGGQLTIEIGTVVIDADAGNGDIQPGTYGRVVVSDTGCGMAAEVRDRVYEPFFTTKEVGKGTGLGLSIVYGFAQQSGGRVDIDSRPGCGTKVTLLLPVATTPAEEIPVLCPPDRLQRGKETVLVVEDDEMVRAHAVESVKSLGYRVIEARDGYEALYFLAINPDVELLFTDVVMPGGLNGKVLAESAKKIKPRLKVAFTSGYTDSILDLENLDAPLLPKPYKRDQLARTLRAALDRIPA